MRNGARRRGSFNRLKDEDCCGAGRGSPALCRATCVRCTCSDARGLGETEDSSCCACLEFFPCSGGARGGLACAARDAARVRQRRSRGAHGQQLHARCPAASSPRPTFVTFIMSYCCGDCPFRRWGNESRSRLYIISIRCRRHRRLGIPLCRASAAWQRRRGADHFKTSAWMDRPPAAPTAALPLVEERDRASRLPKARSGWGVRVHSSRTCKERDELGSPPSL